MAVIYTIGHSTRTFEELRAALEAHGVGLLIDIRAFPRSRRLPHFNREALEAGLPAAHIDYRWMKDLGGYRKKTRDDSPNSALRNQSFRNYADYMLTETFQAAAQEVVHEAEERERSGNGGVAIMCAEALFTNCHRMLVSDWMAAHGHRVLHIRDEGPVREHRMLAEAKVADGQLTYPGLF